jgi:hypothetical protein
MMPPPFKAYSHSLSSSLSSIELLGIGLLSQLAWYDAPYNGAYGAGDASYISVIRENFVGGGGPWAYRYFPRVPHPCVRVRVRVLFPGYGS